MEPPMNPNAREQEIFQRIQEHLKTIEPLLDVTKVTPNDSLSGELGLDSLRLASLFDRLRQEHAGVNLTPWFMSASQEGGDSVGSLVTFLLKATASKVPPP